MLRSRKSPEIQSTTLAASDKQARELGYVKTVKVQTKEHGTASLIIAPRGSSYHTKMLRTKVVD